MEIKDVVEAQTALREHLKEQGITGDTSYFSATFDKEGQGIRGWLFRVDDSMWAVYSDGEIIHRESLKSRK